MEIENVLREQHEESVKKQKTQFAKTKEFLLEQLDKKESHYIYNDPNDPNEPITKRENTGEDFIIGFPESLIDSVGGPIAYQEFLEMLGKNYSIKKDYDPDDYTELGYYVPRPEWILCLTLLKK